MKSKLLYTVILCTVFTFIYFSFLYLFTCIIHFLKSSPPVFVCVRLFQPVVNFSLIFLPCLLSQDKCLCWLLCTYVFQIKVISVCICIFVYDKVKDLLQHSLQHYQQANYWTKLGNILQTNMTCYNYSAFCLLIASPS